MELVYLWVEDYKNIHQQGFNFSGRYRCNYDPDTNELTIDENTDYVHIFPENINVMAIVGENGSGKSSLLVGLTNHKIVVEKNSKLLSNDFNHADIEPLNRQEDYEIVYVDFDLIKITSVRDYWDYFAFNIFDKNLYTNVENGIDGNNDFNIYKFRENFFKLIIKHEKLFKTNLFFYNPTHISFSFYIALLDKKNDDINKLINLVNKPDFDDHRERFLIFLLRKVISEAIDPVYSHLLIKKEKDALSFKAEILKQANIDNIDELYAFLDELSHYDINNINIEEEFRAIYSKYNKAFIKLVEIGYLKFDFKDLKGREYFDLSQGERKLFTELLMIHDAITKTEKQDIFLVLDEPDLTLHPKWQRKYINEIINFLSKHDKKFHLIITSHSPFILSDIPKENVIFLEDGKQIFPSIETFGANIHTLLSHGFFMDGGLMGEFAKEKINQVINYLNDKESEIIDNETAQKYINIIGEPILKRQLQKMLDRKRLRNFDEVSELKNQIESLKNRLDILVKNS